MDKKIKVSASILCADFTKLGNEIKMCEDAGIDSIHIDVMDGHFVPVISIGAVIIKAIRPITNLPIEAHLMVEHPSAYIEDFINAGADIISIHAECYGQLRPHCTGFGCFPKEVDEIKAAEAKKDINKIKAKGKKVEIVINPGTPFCIGQLLEEIDGILFMSVNPGFAGQKFMPEVLPKIQEARKIFKGEISIDGGINYTTAAEAIRAGVDTIVTASYLFNAKDKPKLVKDLKEKG